ncbi:MAG: hypothetical protein QF561_04955 [Phycisphaerales bacterium]|jgi:hypothetical protein|nr:hypothetical protein [Phycisphaerales bacterium]
MNEPPFELEPDELPDPPDLPGEVIVKGSIDEAIDALVDGLFASAEDAVDQRGRFDLALPPQRALEPVWFRMMLATEYRLFPWAQTHVWLTDSDVTAAARLQETLIWPAGIPIEQVHPMPRCSPSEYQTRLEAALPGRPLDAVVLAADSRSQLDVSLGGMASVFLNARRIAVLASVAACVGQDALSDEVRAAADQLHWCVAPA